MFSELQKAIEEQRQRQQRTAELLEEIQEQQALTAEHLSVIAQRLDSADVELPEPQPPSAPEPQPPADRPRANTLELGDDDEQQEGQVRQSGVRIVPKEPLEALECRLSSKTDGVTRAYLRAEDGQLLQIRSIDDLSSGDSVTFVRNLSADTPYRVVFEAPNETYTRGRASVSYPVENDLLEVTHGIYTEGGSRSSSYRYCIDRITPTRRTSSDGGVAAYESDLSELTRAANARRVSNPSGSGECTEIRYPKNEFLGINERTRFPDVLGREPRTAHARYEMFVPHGFEWRSAGSNGGTKLPGFAHHNSCGAGGSICRGEGFSARMFSPRPGGKHGLKCKGEVALGLQVYDATHSASDLPYGWHDMWDIGPDLGTWAQIDCRVTLGRPGRADDQIRGWVDEKEAYDRSDYLFFNQQNAERGIKEWRWHYYFGGSWRSPTDNRIYVRNFQLFVDDDVPAM